MYTAAYRSFRLRLEEVQKLQSLARQLEVSRKPIALKRARALRRAGVVLLCSHVEGYFEDLTEIILEKIVRNKLRKKALGDKFLYHLSKDLIREIQDARDFGAIAAKVQLLLKRDWDVWSDNPIFKSPLAHDRFIVDFSSPSFEKIRALIGRFGYSEFRKDLGHSLSAKAYAVVPGLGRAGSAWVT